MAWRSRVLLGRLRDQASVVATVTLVAVVATSLLATLALLLDLTANGAVDEALDRAPAADVQIDVLLRVGGADAAPAVATADRVLDEVVGDVPAARTEWLEGVPHRLVEPERTGLSAVAYLASYPRTDDTARLVRGTWPERATDDQGRVEVNVPEVAAAAHGWDVGSVVSARRGRDDVAWVVVGTHELLGPPRTWSRDPLGGAGHDPAYPAPGALGVSTTDAWGPFLVAPDALAGENQVETAHVVLTPRLGGAPRGAVAHLRTALDDAQVALAQGLGAGTSGTVSAPVATTVDAAWRELAVTRIGVLVVGLLLTVLATTVMLLSARLLAERRASEGELLAARGGSARQLRSLAVLEAAVVAALTWLVAPWAALLALGRLTASGPLARAGYMVPDAPPGPVLLATGVVAVALAVALVVPAWHTAGSTSRAPHASLARAGADVALVVLAGLALAQLVTYGAPLVTGGGGARLDPVLVAGPAVVTLGAAVIALRLVGPLGRLGDALARRTRSFVGPMAAWQVARRPEAAAGTCLVIVLAVATATFGQSFQATWRLSQLEQVDLATGADLRVTGLGGEPGDSSQAVTDALAAAPRVDVRPVVDRSVRLGYTDGSSGALTTVQLLGVDTAAPQDLRGRTATPWSELLATLPERGVREPLDAGTLVGVPLPEGTDRLSLDAVAGTVPSAPGTTTLAVAVEDARGVRTWASARDGLGGGDVRLDTPTRLEVAVPPGVEPRRLVAVQALMTLEDLPPEMTPGSAAGTTGDLGLSVSGALAHDDDTGTQTALPLAPAGRAGLVATIGGTLLTARIGQEANAPSGAAQGGDALHLDARLGLTDATQGPVRLTATAWPTQGVVPAVLTADAARQGDVQPGDVLPLRVGSPPVQLRVEAVVPYLPGAPRGAAVMVDREALQRAATESGMRDPLVDAWWGTGAGPDVEAAAAALRQEVDATVVTRGAARVHALEGPLRAAVPAALTLVVGTAGLLVLVGMGADATATVRSRRLELARLQALGLSRGAAVRGVLAENLTLVVLGAGAGLLIGYGLAALLGPLLTVSPDGLAPVPRPLLVWPWPVQGAVVGALVTTAGVAVALLVATGVRRASGALLRLGDDR
ncbi:ABC transporter permease [Cellulomonas iranensis]|uniref:ABC transporter permease n=1 Tax=Cellulomonas iranensis TaxID=76862 RepID=UPI0013CF4C5B|nr:FtsX-like permease family protein [Cellulomonas iranensis]